MTVADTETIGSLSDLLHDQREKLRENAAEHKRLKEEYDDIEWRLIAALDLANSPRGGGAHSLVSIEEKEVPKPQDWDLIHKWAVENNMLHIFERRLSVTAYRELLSLGKTIDGCETFTQRKISLRSAK